MTWWLLGNLWWLVPVLFAVAAAGIFAFGVWPVVLAFLRGLSPAVAAIGASVIGAVIVGSGLYALGKSHGRDACAGKQEAVETRADRRAEKVSTDTAEKVENDRSQIRKENADAVAEVRTIVRTVRAECPAVPLPPRVHDLGRAAVEAARAELPAGRRGDP